MSSFIENVGATVGSRLGTKVNYGDPMTIGGVEIIPVSIVQFGFGGGSDSSGDGGGGGGGVSIPVGAYVAGPNGPEFRPNTVVMLAVLVPILGLAGGIISKVAKALRQ